MSTTLSPDLAQKPEALNGSPEPVFTGLLADWSRHIRGGITVAHITGAAVSGCAPGIGWPLRTTP